MVTDAARAPVKLLGAILIVGAFALVGWAWRAARAAERAWWEGR